MPRRPTDAPDWRAVGWSYRALHAFPAPQHDRLLLRVRGLEHVPARGGVVLASNHCSYWDPVVFCTMMPRPVAWLGKKEAMSNPVTRWFFIRQAGCIPVDRRGRNPEAVAAGVQALREGRMVGVFPEGTRYQGALGPAKTGAARLALDAGVPILPVGLASDSFWPIGRASPDLRRKIYVRIGAPFSLDDADAVAGTGRLMGVIAELLAQARAARERDEAWPPPS